MYTDGSVDHESGKVAVGMSRPEIGYKKGNRTGGSSVALRWVEDNKQGNSIICSDSAATLTTIKETISKSRLDVVVELLQSLFRTHKVGMRWVSVGSGTCGCERERRKGKGNGKEGSEGGKSPAGKTSTDQLILCFGAGMLVTSMGCVNNLFHIAEYEE